MMLACAQPSDVRTGGRGTKATAPTVVLVEDYLGMQTALKRVLEISGFNVQAFVSAELCLASSASANADCFVCDVHLTGDSGFDLCRQLAQGGSKVPVIFITARDSPAVRATAEQLGAAAYLAKPFDGRMLVSAVKEATRTRLG
jgi:FixJ family two-component response regulator